MVDKIPRFQYVLISISDTKLKFRSQYSSIKQEYQSNIYYYGSDVEYSKFISTFGHIQRIEGVLSDLVDNCQYYYVDHNAIDRIEDFVFNSKIRIIENDWKTV